MAKKKIRIYVDTSVVGGCFDEEFRADSLRFFDYVRQGKIILLYSTILMAELELAPDYVRNYFLSFEETMKESVPYTPEIELLAQEYLNAGIVAEQWRDDCNHVAMATVTRAAAIVSWNFKHIVRFDKMRLYNQVNLQNGYGLLSIVSPREVIFDEN